MWSEALCVIWMAMPMLAVAQDGPSALYSGKYASSLAKDIKRDGGIITVKDLEDARAELKQPLKGRAFGVEFVMPPPPSSAAAVFAGLKVLEGFDLPLAGSGIVGIHRQIEALKHAFALRMSMGDPGPAGASWKVPHLDKILADISSEKYIESLRSLIMDDTVRNVTDYGGKWNILDSGVMPEDHGTTHISVVDKDGTSVSITSTVNTGFGSKVLSRSTGILLNNQMDDFSTPDQPNVYGLQPTPSNFIYPGKKPFSSMSPMILHRGDNLLLVVGASGGPRIISAVFQTIARVLNYGEDLFRAVVSPRFHHQLIPETLYGEQWNASGMVFNYEKITLEELAEKGHRVQPTNWGAVVQAIQVQHDGSRSLYAVSDARKDGSPSGY